MGWKPRREPNAKEGHAGGNHPKTRDGGRLGPLDDAGVCRDAETGKRECVVKIFARKKDAKDEATRLENVKAKGGLMAPSKQPLEKYLKGWVDDAKNRSRLRLPL